MLNVFVDPHCRHHKIIYPPSSDSNPLSNSLIDNKIKKLDDALFGHESQITDLNKFSQLYTQKYATLKFEYEQKVLMIEKSIVNQNLHLETHIKKLEVGNHNLFLHLIQLIRRIEILEETPKRKKIKRSTNNNPTIIFPPLPRNIDVWSIGSAL